jgi:hypothetical protein
MILEKISALCQTVGHSQEFYIFCGAVFLFTLSIMIKETK